MQVNDAGIRLLKEFEGWRSNAYYDAVGVLTIGYGHTSRAGPPEVYPGQRISLEEGEEILRRDLQTFEAAVRKLVKVALNSNQYSALVSFCYNVGPGNFKKSSVLRYVNAKRFSDVPARLALWNKAGGRVLRGLTRRRAAEGNLFITPVQIGLVAQDLEDARTVRGDQIVQRTGKSAMQSTTNRAAGGVTAAVLIDQGKEVVDLVTRAKDTASEVVGAVPAGIDWSALAWPIAISLAACFGFLWIVHERHKKSVDDGV